MKLRTITALLLSLAAPLFAATPTPDDGKQHKFSLHDFQFFIDDQPTRILAGEIHPGRIPSEFWDDRIKKAKAMGLNTISAYFFWNQIEPTEGNFVFKDMTDIRRFVKLCQDNGMWVALRPGPYCCAEFEFGGFPAWLLKHPGLHVRTNEAQYMAYCKKYIEKVAEQLRDLQVTHGGPILMVQLENELHRIDDYLKELKDDFTTAGFDTQLFTCDPSGTPWTTIEGLPNVLRGYNGMDPNDRFQMRYDQSTAVNKPMGYPIYSPEVYTGWFATFGSWGPFAKSPKVAVEQQVTRIQFLLDHKDVSFCLYVFNGGTNFGFTSGANGNHPMQTSYDYDAPVDEIGRVTPKFKALREIIAKSENLQLPPIPADPKVIEVPAFQLHVDAPLLARLPKDSVDAENVKSMEDLDQNFGFVLYRKTFESGLKGTLNLGKPRDYVSIMVNGKVIGEAFNGFGGGRNEPDVSLAVDQEGPCTLDILVHNFGRNSLFTNEAGARKGLMGNPLLDTKPLTGWKMYSLPMDNPDLLPSPPAGAGSATAAPAGPTLYSGTFTLNAVGETYLDMSQWHCGVVYVNGHNLGRYWDIGASRAIYLPSSWQKVGENQVTVLELGKPPMAREIRGVTNMIETPAVRATPFWTAAPATAPAAPPARGNP